MAIKWIAPEEGSIQAQRLREGFRLIAPDLIYAECANIVWKKVRRGNIPASKAVQAIEILTGVDVERFHLGRLHPLRWKSRPDWTILPTTAFISRWPSPKIPEWSPRIPDCFGFSNKALIATFAPVAFR